MICRRRSCCVLVLAALAPAISGCGGGEELPRARPAVPAAEEKMSLDRQVLAARAGLARRLGVPPDDVDVVEAREVTWPDSALGCPEPGMVYSQVLTPGVLIVLEHRGQTYRYHAQRASVARFCPPERAQPPVPGEPAGA